MIKEKQKKTEIEWEAGFSLIAMAVFILIGGLLLTSGFKIYDVWREYKVTADTDEKIQRIQASLQQFLSENGRYPCPAPLDASIDSDGYGKEVSTNCAAGALPGTFRAQGRGGRWVRTGAIPVYTLNLPAADLYDGYNRRFIYAVTEQYAIAGQTASGDSGAIFVQDGNGNDATFIPGSVVQTVYSMGRDPNGAYSLDGVLLQPCDTGALSGENCDFDSNAVFVNTLNKSTKEDNLFVHRISYEAQKYLGPCEDNSNRPKHTSFLIDTSTSMRRGGDCPDTMPGCSRLDVARWAIRRVLPATIHNKVFDGEPGKTGLTGFTTARNVSDAESLLGDIIVDDPTQSGYNMPGDQELLTSLERRFEDMCPESGTPLGVHMLVLAERLRLQMLEDIANGGNPERFSKVIVFSDGKSNKGISPERAAERIAAMRDEDPPIHIQIDIIDVVGTRGFDEVAATTGGTYYPTSDPDTLLESLYDSAGICGSYTPVEPEDKRGCDSSGDWGDPSDEPDNDRDD